MELNEKQIEQNDRIDNAAFELLRTLAVPEDMSEEQEELFFPWDIYLINELIEAAADILRANGYPKLYRPYLDEDEIVHDYDEDIP